MVACLGSDPGECVFFSFVCFCFADLEPLRCSGSLVSELGGVDVFVGGGLVYRLADSRAQDDLTVLHDDARVGCYAGVEFFIEFGVALDGVGGDAVCGVCDGLGDGAGFGTRAVNVS